MRVLGRIASLAQTGELARRLHQIQKEEQMDKHELD